MIKELIKLADHLDSKGLVEEADYLDRITKKAQAKPVYKNTLTDFPKKNQRFIFIENTGIAYILNDEGSLGSKNGENFFKLTPTLLKALQEDIKSNVIIQEGTYNLLKNDPEW